MSVDSRGLTLRLWRLHNHPFLSEVPINSCNVARPCTECVRCPPRYFGFIFTEQEEAGTRRPSCFTGQTTQLPPDRNVPSVGRSYSDEDSLEDTRRPPPTQVSPCAGPQGNNCHLRFALSLNNYLPVPLFPFGNTSSPRVRST